MISIKIKKSGEPDFIDRTNQIRDFSIVMGTTKEATTAALSVDHYGSKYLPEGGDEVEIYDGSDKIFGGFIIRSNQKLLQGPVLVYDCDLKNMVHRLDYKLVNLAYENETAHDIIEDIVSNFSGPGITTTNVEDDASAIITSISFNNIPPSEAIQQIADLLNKEWYVDQDGDIHFFSKLGEDAPFGLSDSGGKYIFESLEFREDHSQIRNSILVEAGEEKSTEQKFDTFIGNAEQHTFTLSRKYTDLEVSVDGVSQDIGIANIDSFASKDVLYDFNLNTIYFDPASPPGDTLEILAGGYYYFPINIRRRSSESIALYGEREHFIQDKSIKSRTDAFARARAEIAAYGSPVLEGSFDTYESGLMAGQKINIESAIRGIDGDFVIQRISGRHHSPDKIIWSVEIVSVKSFELIDLLAQIIKGRRLESPVDAVIGVAESVERVLVVSRDILTYTNDPPIWVAGPWTPVSLEDRRRVAFADRTCLAS